QEWIDSLDATAATSYINHVQQSETTFKQVDVYIEEIEEKLNDDCDDDVYSGYGTDTDDDDK
ncbi:unnamed protein product, partial [Rotaria sp. Silwood1]